MDTTLCDRVIAQIARIIVGKTEAVQRLLIALIADGHVLIEDVPGVAKTLLAKTLAKSIGGTFKRIQFTPDLMPTDITGFEAYDPASGTFSFHPGPVMTHVLLADEINRTIPRTQSSLLECMQERQVTVDGRTHLLPTPFFVLATQNPIELEGTFPLPEAQLDRFLLKIELGYPTKAEEKQILERFQQDDPFEALTAVVSTEDIIVLQQARKQIRISEPVRDYIAALVRATRRHEALEYGASPRASLALMRVAQAQAMLKGRAYVLPDDVKSLAQPVLAHRLILEESARIRRESRSRMLDAIIDRIPVPAASGRTHDR